MNSHDTLSRSGDRIETPTESGGFHVFHCLLGISIADNYVVAAELGCLFY